MTKTRTKTHKIEKVSAFSFNHSGLWLIATLILVISVYYSVTRFDQVGWDDKMYLKETPIVQGLTWENVKSMFTSKVLLSYNPLVLLSFAVDYETAHLDPQWSHLINLLFHVLNSLLLFMCMLKMRFKKEAAGIIAILFAIHPLSVEAVAWLAGRKDVLYGFFYLFAWLFYLQYVLKGRKINYFLSVLLFLFALFSKVQAITLPFILIISDYIINGEIKRKELLNKIPFILLSILFGLIAISGSTLVADKYSIVPDFSDKVLYSFMAIGIYVYKILLPFSQSAIYAFPKAGTAEYLTLLAGGIVTTALLIYVIIYSYKKARIVAGGIMFFLVSIFVVLHVVAFNSSLIYERFAYLAGIGIFISITHLEQLFPEWNKYKLKILLPVAIIFSVICFQRVQIWKNSETFWTDVIAKNPAAAAGWNNRGMYYLERDELEKAESDFNNCILNVPEHPDAYNNRSIIYFRRKNYAKALEDNSLLLKIDSSHKEGYNNRASYFYAMQKYDSAQFYYLKATQLNSNNASAFFFAGVSEYNMKLYDVAIDHFKRAINILPNYSDAYVFMGLCYVRIEKEDSVLYCIDRSEKLTPESGARSLVGKEYLTIGNDLFNSGKWQEAIQAYNKAYEINPKDADALYRIGGVYISRQDVTHAREYWKKSVAINPQQKEANEWLAKIGN